MSPLILTRRKNLDQAISIAAITQNLTECSKASRLSVPAIQTSTDWPPRCSLTTTLRFLGAASTLIRNTNGCEVVQAT
ncbi:hypothetical protein [Xanthomonas fragariae]|uniref:hypothetical protein n=1 Tax=Xanthomonas fragariae TaxID=48664 RepID=UPI0035315483